MFESAHVRGGGRAYKILAMSVIYLEERILTQCDETSFKDLNCKVHVYSSSRGLPDGAVLLTIHMVGHVLWIVERILRFSSPQIHYFFFRSKYNFHILSLLC